MRLAMSEMEAGRMTLMSEVFKVTYQVRSCGGLAALVL